MHRLALALALLASPLVAQEKPPQAGVEVIFLDVGQGDAVLIRSLEGNAALIDAGPGKAVVSQLRRFGISSLDLLVASHPHYDHIGGIIPMLQCISVGHYLDNGEPYDSQEWRFLRRIIEELDIPRLTLEPQEFTLGRVTLRIIPPPARPDWSTNNRSIGIVLEYGKFRALFTGDSEREELGYFLQQGVPKVTLLKAAHHGAGDGVNPGWIQGTSPEVVVISAGRGNRFGHPHDIALRYYGTRARTIFRTDLHGTVRITGHLDGTWTADTDVD